MWQADIYEYIRSVVSLQGSLGIERMCHLAGVSRAGFYRHLRASDNYEEEMHVQSEIQRIHAIDNPLAVGTADSKQHLWLMVDQRHNAIVRSQESLFTQFGTTSAR